MDALKNQLLISAESFYRSEEIERAQMENQEIGSPAECFSVEITILKHLNYLESWTKYYLEATAINYFNSIRSTFRKIILLQSLENYIKC